MILFSSIDQMPGKVNRNEDLLECLFILLLREP